MGIYVVLVMELSDFWSSLRTQDLYLEQSLTFQWDLYSLPRAAVIYDHELGGSTLPKVIFSQISRPKAQIQSLG